MDNICHYWTNPVHVQNSRGKLGWTTFNEILTPASKLSEYQGRLRRQRKISTLFCQEKNGQEHSVENKLTSLLQIDTKGRRNSRHSMRRVSLSVVVWTTTVNWI